jgi:hypothetical protein
MPPPPNPGASCPQTEIMAQPSSRGRDILPHGALSASPTPLPRPRPSDDQTIGLPNSLPPFVPLRSSRTNPAPDRNAHPIASTGLKPVNPRMSLHPPAGRTGVAEDVSLRVLRREGRCSSHGAPLIPPSRPRALATPRLTRSIGLNRRSSCSSPCRAGALAAQSKAIDCAAVGLPAYLTVRLPDHPTTSLHWPPSGDK